MSLPVNVTVVLLSAFVVSSALPSAHAGVTGKVVGALDGDTIEVLHNTHSERIRLNGIDCPEKGQLYGTKAKQARSDLVLVKKSVCIARQG